MLRIRHGVPLPYDQNLAYKFHNDNFICISLQIQCLL